MILLSNSINCRLIILVVYLLSHYSALSYPFHINRVIHTRLLISNNFKVISSLYFINRRKSNHNSYYKNYQMSSSSSSTLSESSNDNNSNDSNRIISSNIDYTHILKQCNAWCGLHGLMYTDGGYNWTPAPLSLLPNIFNKDAYNYAYQIQPILNLLIDRISRDKSFLLLYLSDVCNSDDFTKRLLDIYLTIDSNYLQSCIQCGILRSDYMLNHDNNRLLQVEINTIASGLGNLSQKVGNFHRYLLDRYQDSEELHQILHEITTKDKRYSSIDIVDNPSNIELSKCLATAHHEYNDPDAIILFVVQPGERNVT